MAELRPVTRFRAWLAGLHPAKLHYGWLALTFAVGLAGAGVFLLARLPLPWMLGPMVFTMVLSLFGVPLTLAQSVRAPMLVVLGVMIGASVTPDLVSHIPQWWLPLLGVVLVLVAGTAANYLYFRRLVKCDPATAYYSAVPGGITEMIILSEASGADHRLVALAQVVRISLVVLCVPFIVQIVTGTTLGARPPAGLPLMSLPPEHIAWFIGTFVVGAILSCYVRNAVAIFLVPMFLSAFLHGSGLRSFVIPGEAGIAAQLVIGLSLGVRFFGMHLRTIGASMLWALGAGVLLVVMAFAAALIVSPLSGEPLIALFLAYSPGGVAEMSLVAVALHMDVAFVVLHHLVRLLLVTTLAGRVFDWATRRRAG